MSEEPTMDDRALISLLQSLAQLDIDACHGYRRTVRRVDDDTVRRHAAARSQASRDSRRPGPALRTRSESVTRRPTIRGTACR